jgi:hypothetical protein
MNIYERMMHFDRRWIFLVIAIAVVIPFFAPLGLPIVVTPPVKTLHDAVEAIPPNDEPILLSLDYAPATVPELEPMALAILRHSLQRDVNVLVMTLHPAGYGLAERAVTQVAEETGSTYGEDFCFLGFQPGISAVILGLGVNIRNVFPEDAYGTPLNQIPMMDGIRNYDDIPLAVTMAGSGIAEAWIYYANQPYGQDVAAGVTAVIATDYYPYLSSGQLTGLLGGMRGAAEYEETIQQHDKGVRGMDSQSSIHVIIIILIVLGNIAYFGANKRKRLAEREA